MKKAVIATGGKQYVVSEGEILEVELLNADGKNATFTPLLVVDGDKISVGAPELSKASVSAEVLDADMAGDKVMSIRYKAKKRVDTRRGHRQHHTRIKITKIS